MNLRVSDDGSTDSPTYAARAGGAAAARASRPGTRAAAAAGAGAATATATAAEAAAGKAADGAAAEAGPGGSGGGAADGAGSVGEAAAAAAVAKRKKLPNPLVWIDLEMTGLDIEKDTIIEIACLVTDGDLKTVVEGPSLAIHHPEAVIESMNDWCKEHHGKSGLTQRVRDSSTSLQEAEEQVLAFVAAHTEFQSAQLAGNSVHVDRMFLQRHMPALLGHLHYRIVDVSSIHEVARRWSPKLARSTPRKKAAHTAMSDIRESLEELRYYKDKLFRGVK
ncbi:putative REX2, RNA exonuclease 2 [Monoraphidium neglectum]|uniref:Putative REX2, RNA exonuclease 2 n=1 Tax=Monoraphidium neglectum TaxID=145388 RepID=A0A0D2MJP5_9CHLO|nr:putative REX2, RNA exonuclease 2 [Monoraphidium neglectum]KIY95155.1 putative REX2, RNA exonuclease 2 [Monoraphidium neglectum]|eukprot:XP_013894175.1 putative REX2, RNA exonuclease 2 [Monoraphidium neglectum]